MNEPRPCIKCQTVAHLSDLNTCPACVTEWVKDYNPRQTKRPDGYQITLWADGFGKWHARANFSPALGNSGEADKLLDNALATARRHIRHAIAVRQPRYNLPLPRLKYEVTANTFSPGIGTLSSITISER